MSTGYELYYGVVFYTITVLLSIAVNAVFYLRARKSELLKAFFNLQAIVVVWLLAKILKIVSPTEEAVWLFVVIQYIGVCFLGVAFLQFSYIYEKGRSLSKKILNVLVLIGLINYSIMFTNPFHHLFFKSVSISSNDYGLWFGIHTLYNYILIGISYFYLIRTLLKNDYKGKTAHALLSYGILLIPLFTNMIYVSGIVKSNIDVTPIVFNITIVAFGYSAYSYQFLDIKSVTRQMILENIHEGIIIIDNNYRIVEHNDHVSNVVTHQGKNRKIEEMSVLIDAGREMIEDFGGLRRKISNCLNNQEDRLVTQFKMNVHGTVISYILKLEKVVDHTKDMSGYVFRFIDVSKQNELLASVKESNNALLAVNQELAENISVAKRLSVAKERSRVSKEVHDILGHSVTVVISLLEMAKRLASEDRGMACEKVSQGMEIIRNGLLELKRSMRIYSEDVIDGKRLNEDLKKLISGFESSGVNVDFFYKGIDAKLPSDTYDTLYRVCQEGLTNALRHGSAENVTIGLRYIDRSIDLYLVDDGNGCRSIEKGNGLSGMENRVKEQKGEFSFGSPDGEGFNIHVKLPL